MTRQRVYYERGEPVEVLIWWAGRGPRNVLIRTQDGQLVVRPFRGLRRQPPPHPPRPAATPPAPGGASAQPRA